MTNVLIVQTSARNQIGDNGRPRSISRRLGEHFIQTWAHKQPTLNVTHRDLAETPPDFVDQDWIAAAFTASDERSTAQQKRLQQSDALIHEVHQADVIVITTPMYNYGMPAVLKAWFDQVVRVNETFTFDLARGDYPLEPVQSGKTLVLLSSSGEFGFGRNEEREHMNHLGPHICTASRYLGIEETFEIGVEYQEFNDERHAQSLARAFHDAELLADSLTTKHREVA